MLKHIRLERPLVVLDLETTGKRVQADRIVEISTLKLLPDGTNKIHTRRLNPGIPIHPEATAVHGITDDDVADEKSFGQIARSLASYLDGCDLCGYNLWSFDLKMLVAEFKRAGVPFSTEGRHILDPMRIFHKREPRDLTAALKFYCSMEHDGAHGAEADVLAALLVLDGQARAVRRPAPVGPGTPPGHGLSRHRGPGREVRAGGGRGDRLRLQRPRRQARGRRGQDRPRLPGMDAQEGLLGRGQGRRP